MKPYALISSFLFALIAVFVLALVPLNAQAVEKPVVAPSKEQPGMKPGTKFLHCPSGWQKKQVGPASPGTITCVPIYPKFDCPTGTEYFQHDCMFGCKNPGLK